MRLFKWARRSSKPAQPALKPDLLPIHHGITLELWQARPDYVKWAHELFLSKEGSELLSVVRNQMPVPPPESNHSFALGRVSGYMEAINVLTSTAYMPPPPLQQIPVTYEPEGKEDNRFEDIAPEPE